MRNNQANEGEKKENQERKNTGHRHLAKRQKGNGESNKGKQANTREGMKSAKAAARQPQSEIREEARKE